MGDLEILQSMMETDSFAYGAVFVIVILLVGSFLDLASLRIMILSFRRIQHACELRLAGEELPPAITKIVRHAGNASIINRQGFSAGFETCVVKRKSRDFSRPSSAFDLFAFFINCDACADYCRNSKLRNFYYFYETIGKIL